jgi:hypothetical protein
MRAPTGTNRSIKRLIAAVSCQPSALSNGQTRRTQRQNPQEDTLSLEIRRQTSGDAFFPILIPDF